MGVIGILLRRLGLFFALLAGGVASQVPEYAQQYRQRLGGALDELNTIVQKFDADSTSAGLTRETAMSRLAANADPFIKSQGVQMRENVARTQRLTRQAQAFAAAGPFTRINALAKDFDPQIARRAYDAFEPALPMTLEGIVSAFFGFIGGFTFMKFLGWPVRRAKARADAAKALRA